MPDKIYLWFSRATADTIAGTTLIGLDGVARIDKGYGIVIDPKTGKLYQTCYGEPDIKDVPKGEDVKLVAAFEMPADQDIVVVDAFGMLTPLGERYCALNGLPQSVDSVLSQVEGFYTPKVSPHAADNIVDLRTLPVADSPET